jgi:NAD(P)H-dependent flavin oxidoreductase YrpB (nitropropane dioxygenase family)
MTAGRALPGALRTPLLDVLGCDVPIVQTGMGWVSGSELTAATCNAGAFGILAGATMTLAELRVAIAEVRRRTDRPFGVNLRADAREASLMVDHCVTSGVRVASFAQAPKQELIKRCKDGGLKVIPSIGAKRHAEKVAAWGVDAVLVQGHEAGGHVGPTATTVLLPQVVDVVDIPVIAAGGFFDGRGLVAALAYGASGIAMGTRFLLTSDSTVPLATKQMYLDVANTVVSRKIDGVPHRVLTTSLVQALESRGAIAGLVGALRNAVGFHRLTGMSWTALTREGLAMRKALDLDLTQMVMAANTPMLLKATMVDGRPEAGVMAGGQVVGVIRDLPSCAELVDRIVEEAVAVLDRLGSAMPAQVP